MGRVHGQGCQHRVDLLLIVRRQPLPIRLVEHSWLQETEALGLQRRSQIVRPASVGIPDQGSHSLRHHPETLTGGKTIGRAMPPFRLNLLLEPGDADLEEFIQVGMGDPEKLHPLEQWNRGIQRLVQDPLVKLQPRKLAIEKASRNPPGRRLGEDLRSF